MPAAGAVMSPVDRWLLPGELARMVDPRPPSPAPPRRTPRDWLVDSALFLAALAIAFVELDHTVVANAYQLPLWIRVLDPVLGFSLVAALWWRRRFPLALGIAATLSSAVSNTATGALLILLASLALHRGWRQAGLVILFTWPVGLPYILVYFPNAGEDPLVVLVVVSLIVLLSMAVGLTVRARRQLVLVLRMRAAEREQEYELRLEESRRDERRRIAREMHDTLAHRISLLTVHAGALEFRTRAAEAGDAPPLSAREVHEVVGVMRESAQAAVDDLREVLQVLRRPEDDSCAEPPQVGVDDIAVLLADARAGGQQVEAELDPALATLRPPLQRTVYRIVQEGLTNARKHAPAAAVSVCARLTDEVTVEVRNPLTTATGGGPTGVGLTGLTERVALHGGSLTHESRDDGFVLRARLPVAP